MKCSGCDRSKDAAVKTLENLDNQITEGDKEFDLPLLRTLLSNSMVCPNDNNTFQF